MPHVPSPNPAGGMPYLPLFMVLRGRPCVVVGGGAVARRKVALLLRADARVTVVAPALEPTLAAWAHDGRVTHGAHRFEPSCLTDAALVIAATDDAVVNQRVAEAARHLGIPVNVVDNAALSTVIVPAIVDRSPLVVAVSSGGRAPVLARLLKARLEATLSGGYGRLAEVAGGFRDRVKASLPDPRARNRFWERAFQGPAARLALAGRADAAEAELSRALDAASREAVTGAVSLVGAGPGDPELLTLRAARLLQAADVVVHDRLVPPAILELARRDAERIDVGKVPGKARYSQEAINALLVRLAREGQRVVRLKGGDPFIFGRGGEELAALTAERVPCEVVPGVTAASGCAARLGIPLTHRDHAHAVVLATGHPHAEGAPLLPPVVPGQTVVVYMAVSRLATVCQDLMAKGFDPATPAALVQSGTTPQERALTATLATIAEEAVRHAFQAPALLIAGDVAGLATPAEVPTGQPMPAAHAGPASLPTPPK